MVRIYVKSSKEKPKKRIEIVDIHPEEAELIVNKIYHAVNKPDICAFCKKPSQFIRIVVDNMTKVYAFKVCRQCLVRR